VVAFGLISSIPRQAWYLLGALAAVGLIAYRYQNSKRNASTRQPPPSERDSRPATQRRMVSAAIGMVLVRDSADAARWTGPRTDVLAFMTFPRAFEEASGH